MVCTKTFRRKNLPIILSIQLLNKAVDVGLIWAGVILLAMYVAIIFEVAHRTVVTMIASTAAITVLAYLNIRPSLEEIVTWVDVETLVLLFGMMVIVSVMSETGSYLYLLKGQFFSSFRVRILSESTIT